MIINLLDIGGIRNINDMRKYSISKPIFLNNYLFHYLILTNNLKGLKLDKFTVFKENEDGLNGFHLAAKYNNYPILRYLVRSYPDYIYNRNTRNENFLHYCDPTNINYKRFIMKYSLDWSYLYQKYSTDNICNLDTLFSMGSYNTIKRIVSKYNFKYDIYNETPTYFNLLLNDQLKTKEIILLLKNIYRQDNRIFSYTDLQGNNFLYPVVLKGNFKLLKYLYKLNEDKTIVNFDAYTPINTYHIFTLAYNKGLVNNDFAMSKYILDRIIDTHDFNETNKDGNNLAHFILKTRMNKYAGNYELEEKILSKYKNWNQLNIDKEAPLDYIVNLDYDKYSKFLKGAEINKKYHTSKIENNKWKKLITKLPKIKADKKQIKLTQTDYSHGNIFQARFTDIAIFCYFLDNKYKNLYLPRYKGKMKSITYSQGIKYPDNMLKEYHNFAWLIVWNDKDSYHIHPHLNESINAQKDTDKDYAFCILSLRLPNDGLHASLVIYDFKRNIIERFDPYGNTTVLDREMDDVLEEELTWNTGFKYYSPSRYFPVAGFQTISDENNNMNMKLGDFGGYCLAWSVWYIEHRLANDSIEPKTLVRKTLNRFMGMTLKPDEYIRNYANMLNKERVSWLTKNGIPENITSNEIIAIEYIAKIRKEIIKENDV
jgi:hypothetical protein